MTPPVTSEPAAPAAAKRPPEMELGFAALKWTLAPGGEIEAVAKAVNGAAAETLPADYLELYHLLRALCMAEAARRADYVPVIKMALHGLPRKAREGGGGDGDAPWWVGE